MVKTENAIEVDNVSYQYDIDGIRTAKNDDGITTNYVVDKNRDYAQVLNELDSSNTPTVSYVYGDDLIKQSRAANDSYYLYDGLGSTRALSNATGTITDTYDYSAYGVEIDSTGTTENNYKYVGEQFDTESGNYYLRARYLNPATGRFISQDTFQGWENDPVTLHKYIYANANPANNIDPSGNFSLGSLMSAINVAARLTTTAVFNVSRLVASRVNGTAVRGIASLRTRIWLTRNVGRVQSRIPRSLGKGRVSDNKNGWRWNSREHDVRVQKGNPRSNFDAQKNDYVKLTVNGRVVGRNGQVLSNGRGAEAHIPLKEWLTWASWKSPL